MTKVATDLPAVERSFPLAPGQTAFWLFEQFGDRTANVVPICVRLRGPFEFAALQLAFRCIVARHDALRSHFIERRGTPMQVVETRVDTTIRSVDLRDLTPTERGAALERAILADARRAFHLDQAPLFRVAVYAVDDDTHVLSFIVHHLVFDGWSTGLLLSELSQFYTTALGGAASPALLPQPPSYADIATWLRRRVAGERRQRELAFWRKELEGMSSTLSLESRDTDSSPQTALPRFRLPVDLAQRVRAFCRERGVTPFSLFSAAFAIVLQRHTGLDRFVIGSPFATRWEPRTHPVIGCLVNTLPLRVELTPEQSFAELVTSIQRSGRRAFSRLELGIHELIAELNPTRTPGQNPVFDVMLNLLNTPAPPYALGDLVIEPFQAVPMASRFALTLYIEARDESFSGWACYRADRMSLAYVETLLAQLAAVIAGAMRAPELAVSTYELAQSGADELRQPQRATHQEPIVHVILAHARAAPDAVAVTEAGVDHSYRDLVTAAEAIACALCSSGVERGEAVAIQGARSFGFIAALLGALRAGCAVLPIDDSLPPVRVARMREQAGATRALWVSTQASDDPHAIRLEPDTARILGPTPATEPAALPTLAPSDRAYVFFTSGSTGTPKGVTGTHAGLAHFLAWQRATFDVQPEDRVAQLTALSFDVALRDIFLPLVSGARLCLPPRGPLDARSVLAWLNAMQVTIWHTVPTLARAWLAHAPEPAQLHALRCVFFAGEPLHASLVSSCRLRLPAAEIINLYGPTETTLAKCYYIVPSDPVAGIQPVGRALPETQALVMHDGTRVCAPGEIGEIVIRTPFCTLGYLNAEPGPSRGFVENPYGAAGDTLYRTGDRARMRPDGLLEILGRFDHQIKIHGCRVEPEEVAACLRQHPHVLEAAVCYVADEHATDDGRLVAYLVVTRGELTQQERTAVRDFLAEHLPAFMVPSELVVLAALPRNASGKLDVKRLPAVARRARERCEPAPPSNELERRVAEIWKSALQLESVGATDSFFDLGGNSLLFQEIRAALQDILGREVSITDLFRRPTVRMLAKLGETAALPQRERKAHTPSLKERADLLGQRRALRQGHRKVRPGAE